MRKRRTAKLAALAQPYLQPGEQVELVTLATVGGNPTRRMVGSAARSGGAWMSVPLRHFIVLTNARLLFFLQNEIGKPRKELAAELPRIPLSVSSRGSSLLYRWMEVLLPDDEAGATLRLDFAVADWSGEKALAAALVRNDRGDVVRDPARTSTTATEPQQLS